MSFLTFYSLVEELCKLIPDIRLRVLENSSVCLVVEVRIPYKLPGESPSFRGLPERG